jgi:hypothetical protein
LKGIIAMMIDEIILSQVLLVNLDRVEETQNFILEVIHEYFKGDSSPLQNGRIDGKLFKRRLERMLEDAIRQKNPTFDLSVYIDVEWGLRLSNGFSCRLHVGVSDFDLTAFQPQSVEAIPTWQ